MPIAKPFPAVVLLGELITLDHCAHGAVEKDDPLAEKRFERMQMGRHTKEGIKLDFDRGCKEQIDVS